MFFLTGCMSAPPRTDSHFARENHPTAPTLFDHEKGIPVHGLLVVSQDLYGVADVPGCCIDVYSHSVRPRTGGLFVLAICPVAGAILALVTGTERNQECLVVPGQEDIPFQFQEPLHGFPAPRHALRPVSEGLLKMK